MQGGRGDPFFGGFGGSFGGPFGGSFGDPFGGSFGSFGGFGGGQRSLISSFFGGRDPFDDPFFTRPFGSMLESNFFGPVGAPFMNPHASGFLENEPPRSSRPQPRGPIIEELNSDDERDEKESDQDKQVNPRKHGRSSLEPFIEDPDDEATEKKSRHVPHRNGTSQMLFQRSQPQSQSFTFQSSTVSYGGANGQYYTSSRTKRSGSDGVTFEECKEANSATREASHRVSRGLNDKGHTVTRNLKSDGHVDTMQTLHNLNEDELVNFEEAWKGNARRHLPGWNEGISSIQDASGYQQQRGNKALPAPRMRSEHRHKPTKGNHNNSGH